MAIGNPFSAFLEACGAAGSLTLHVSDSNDAQPVRRALPQPFAILGYDPHADVPLPQGEASRRHAFLQVIAGRVVCYDLFSQTGTYWGEARKRWGWLEPHEPIGIGRLQIRAELQDTNHAVSQRPLDNPLEPCLGHELPCPPVTLEFLNGKTRQSQCQIDRVLTLVGSGPGSRVRLRGKSVDTLHCYLLATPSGMWMIDLLSSAGTFHNGIRVRFAPLNDGDHLLVGGFLLRVRVWKAKEESGVRNQEGTVRSPESGARSQESQVLAEGGDPGAAWTPDTGHRTPDAFSGHRTPDSFPGPRTPDSFSDSFALQPLPLRLPVQSALVVGQDTGMAAVMNQFSLMQMQMFEQFQQTMLMMFQMFGNLQQEQTSALREELSRIHDLTRELEGLRDSLKTAAQPANERESPVAGVCDPGTPASKKPATEKMAAENGKGHPKPTQPPAAPLPELKHPAAGKSQEELHSWLLGRMESIQEERQTRWQKIMEMLGAKKSQN